MTQTSDNELEVLYRDDDLVVINKPSGLLVHRGWDNDKVVAMTLIRDLVGHHVYPVHRLDRPTSGALIMALHKTAARALSTDFEHGRVAKAYLALVRGVTPERGIIDPPVPKKPKGERVPAVTTYERQFTFERYSWVAAWPKTGRLHQIRRHLKHITHPLIGDVKYGKGEHNRLFRERFGLTRLALHASSIAWRHPRSGEACVISAPVPADLGDPLRAMGVPDAYLEISAASEGSEKLT